MVSCVRFVWRLLGASPRLGQAPRDGELCADSFGVSSSQSPFGIGSNPGTLWIARAALLLSPDHRMPGAKQQGEGPENEPTPRMNFSSVTSSQRQMGQVVAVRMKDEQPKKLKRIPGPAEKRPLTTSPDSYAQRSTASEIANSACGHRR